MKIFIIALFCSISFSVTAQQDTIPKKNQRCVCEYIEINGEFLSQQTILEETDSIMVSITIVDSIKKEVAKMLEQKIPNDDSIIHVNWGNTCIILTDIGDAVIFRKCVCDKR